MCAKILPNIAAGDYPGYNIETYGPTGPFPAVLVDVEDSFGVTLPKYGEPGVTEVKDTVQFLFAYSAEGGTHLVSSWSMTQSGSDRSTLFKLLRDMKGTPPVFDGVYDYSDDIGQTCQITVASKVSQKGRKYNYIASIAPLLSELQDKAPKFDEVEVPGGRRVPLLTDEEDPFKVEEEA